MFDADYQVVDVLMLVGNIAPIAIYFLVLGLVNSHARPCLITSRSDFIALTSVLVPVLLWPLPTLLRTEWWWMLPLGLVVAAGVFVHLLPKAHAGFVVYNASQAQCARVLEHAIQRLGWKGRWEGLAWRDECGRLAIHVRKFALLRNVSLHVEAADDVAKSLAPKLGREMERRLASISQLPSTMGVGLVVVGVSLMILPMWMVSRHIQDLVDAMFYLFG